MTNYFTGIERYYQDQNQLEQDYYYDYCHARSASPQTRKERKCWHHQKRKEPRLNKTNVPFVVNQPMMNPMMHYQQQQILGACATDPLFHNGSMPQPMIQQPYYFQIPTTNVFGTGFQQPQQPFFPNLLYPLINDLMNSAQQQDQTTNNDMNTVTTTPASATATATVTAAATATATENIPSSSSATATADSAAVEPKEPEATKAFSPVQKPSIHRRRSMIETVLSTFSGNDNSTNNNNSTTLHRSWGPSSYVSLDEALSKDAKAADSLSPPSSVSNITTTTDESSSARLSSPNRPTLSRKTSSRLTQKANALQMRQYIWCYRLQTAEEALWAAFDVKNQAKLDKHYASLLFKRQQQMQQQQPTENEEPTVPALPNEVLILTRQSQLNGPVTVSLATGVAWCLNNDPSFSIGSNSSGRIILDVACLPRQDNQFVVSNDYMMVEAEKERGLRKSKSVDGLATRLLNTVLSW
jgi:hypothetical protein